MKILSPMSARTRAFLLLDGKNEILRRLVSLDFVADGKTQINQSRVWSTIYEPGNLRGGNINTFAYAANWNKSRTFVYFKF